MKNDLQQVALPTFVGLAALLELLEEKGIITEDEYTQKYEEATNIVVDSFIEEAKKNL